MERLLKRSLLPILLYLAPIFLSTLIVRTMASFTLSVGIMTILLGLYFKLMPSFKGSKKEANKASGFIFMITTGIYMIILTFISRQ